MKVEAVGISKVLENLRNSAWLVPSFQRDFVWSEGDVVNLVSSIIDARPIGMATLWEQPDESALDLDSINIPDRQGAQAGLARFSDPAQRPNKIFAILDGRQRCTAIAMAFGGFRSQDPKRKFSGRFYLNASSEDPLKRVVYFKDSEVRAKQLDVDSACIAQGLFPLSSNVEDESLFEQWMRYLQALYKPEFYPNGQMPSSDELRKRDGVVKAAFSGINQTLLAVYVVPQTFTLGDICEIFETLNTTGTKVSTVDLIHSWLYTDTSGGVAEPLSLRDWIDELGQQPGAIGWASRDDRPELIAQMVTACYLGLGEERPAPRQVGRKLSSQISSVKAGDLLATPTAHWVSLVNNTERFASYLNDFQMAVAGSKFPYSRAPYPASAAIYMSIRWHMYADTSFGDSWTLSEVDSIYRAFYWRNALSGRYDQGFLSQIGTDIKAILGQLAQRRSYATAEQWAEASEQWLSTYMEAQLPSRQQVVDWLTDMRPAGARLKALTLPIYAGARRDILDPDIDLTYPSDESLELQPLCHKNFLRNSGVDKSDREIEKNYTASISNLIPISRKSSSVLRTRGIAGAVGDFGAWVAANKASLDYMFIDSSLLELLTESRPNMSVFCEARASRIADHLLSQCQVRVR
ncbi:TPA: DUF262 domain-containing protein [Stenotrophomonas maltophilia]|nr:DUF262 domain-containing protein [Stenotrophomonas maltophilia]